MLENDKEKKDSTDDGMTDGVPTEVSDAIDKALESNEDNDVDDDVVDKTDDKVDDKVDDNVEDETNDSTDDSTDDDSTDGGDKDADEAKGIDVLGYDAERIQKLNDIDPNIVEDIKALLERDVVKKSSEDDTNLVPKTTEKVEAKGTITEEQLAELEKENPAMAAIVKNLSTTVGELSTALNSVTEDEAERAQEAQDKEHYNNFRSMNKKLDGLSKDFPILGMYDKLPVNADGVPDDRNRSVKTRADIWGKANALYNTGMFGSFDESFENAIVLYQGKNGKNLAMREVVKDLNSRSKQMTSRPSKNKTKVKQPKPGSDAAKEKIVDDALKASGATA